MQLMRVINDPTFNIVILGFRNFLAPKNSIREFHPRIPRRSKGTPKLAQLPCHSPDYSTMASAISSAAPHVGPSAPGNAKPFISKWSNRYRGATVQDLEPPAALSLTPSDPISLALISAFEREYTHLTIVDKSTRALLGYIAIPQLQSQLDASKVQPEDPLSKAMTRFQRKGKKYKVITMATPLEELEGFFEGGVGGEKQNFAVVTDEARRFVLGVATRDDLEEFVKRRPA